MHDKVKKSKKKLLIGLLKRDSSDSEENKVTIVFSLVGEISSTPFRTHRHKKKSIASTYSLKEDSTNYQ